MPFSDEDKKELLEIVNTATHSAFTNRSKDDDKRRQKAEEDRTAKAAKAEEAAREQRAAEIKAISDGILTAVDERFKGFDKRLQPLFTPAGGAGAAGGQAGAAGGAAAGAAGAAGAPNFDSINWDEVPAFKVLKAEADALKKANDGLKKGQEQLAREREQEKKEKEALAAQARRDALLATTLKTITTVVPGIAPHAAEAARDLLLLRGHVKYGDDDKNNTPLFFSPDSDLPKDLPTGVGEWLKKPEQKMYLPAQVPGGGSGGGSGGGAGGSGANANNPLARLQEASIRVLNGG